MKHIQRSALLPYAQEQLFAMVADIERYTEFLPWLESVVVLPAESVPPESMPAQNQTQNQAADRLVEARVQLKVAGIRESFITRNHMHPPERMELELLEGPFDAFEGFWRFTPLGDATSANTGCKVELDLRFELSRSNPIVRHTYGALVERAAGKLVEAFCQRAVVVCDAPA